MATLNLIIDNNTRAVSKSRSFAGVELENLQDTFSITFSDTFVDGDATLEYQVNGNAYYIELTKDAEHERYTIDITQTLISQEGTYPFQVRIQTGEAVFKSQMFYLYIYPSINAVDGAPDYYGWQEWVAEYVAEHGGDISEIKQNGKTLPIVDRVVDIETPTKTSDLQNDSGFITESAIPTDVSQLNNDSGYITADVDNLSNYTPTSDLSNVATSGDYEDLLNTPTIPEVDQTYDDTSTNAQSGIAVAEAIAGIPTGSGLYRHTITMQAQNRDSMEVVCVFTNDNPSLINTQQKFEDAFTYNHLKLDITFFAEGQCIAIIGMDYNTDGSANAFVSLNSALAMSDITTMVSSYSDSITQL